MVWTKVPLRGVSIEALNVVDKGSLNGCKYISAKCCGQRFP